MERERTLTSAQSGIAFIKSNLAATELNNRRNNGTTAQDGTTTQSAQDRRWAPSLQP